MSEDGWESAVAVPFYRGAGGELRVVLIERSAGGRHGGQVALPGGRREPADATPADTALRETCEELGIGPDGVRILEPLPVASTMTTKIQVHPFVARLTEVPDPWRPQEAEVAAVLDVPVTELADPANRAERTMSFAAWPEPLTVPVRQVLGRTLWGLTLRILDPVLPAALAGAYRV